MSDETRRPDWWPNEDLRVREFPDPAKEGAAR
jgi:hypothetical protein